LENKAGHWWDKLGKPQYGGEIVVRSVRDILNFDPYNGAHLTQVYAAWLERPFSEDWTVDPAVFDYQTMAPNQFMKGLLAESWEFTDPYTFVIHIRKGIHWQNLPPVNGREFTADDVAFHFHRLLGLGSGFTKPAPYHATVASTRELKSVTAVDRYTAVFKWSTPNPEFILETMVTNHNPTLAVGPREVVEKWGDLGDWHHAVGTGPFMIRDFTPGGAASMVKNPDYWGYDERYPQNRLPYIDKLNILIIPDNATALAAMRTGKIDAVDISTLQQANDMKKTNPEILQFQSTAVQTVTVDPRNDVKPFNDIRVREAMQMAIDLPTIAKTYYGGTVDTSPSTLTAIAMVGWGFPYNQWPQDLKDQYAYNPTAAKQLLAAAGYPNGFNTDVVVDQAADLDLLQIVKSYFAAVGINMEIRAMESTAWTAFVQIGHKQDQFAMRGTGGLLGMSSAPISQLTRFQTGGPTNWIMFSSPVFDAFYNTAMNATSYDGVKQVLKAASEYVAQQHLVISLLQAMPYYLCQPWLKGYQGQYQSIVGGTGGPSILGFYAARFWIDQNVKKSLRH
jgi:peptide/nickel transport system substrate-binding protein